MPTYDNDTIAVIFVNQRTGTDEAGYQAAAAAMDALAKEQCGYRGIDSVRDADGAGITVSYWQDEDAAKSWRDNAEHAAIREAGRDRWYASYSVHVAAITRSYDWTKRP
jgi:heme-degrading monooxygenase HmoA